MAGRPDYRVGDAFGARDGGRRLVLDGRATRELNAILAELRRLDKVTTASKLAYESGPDGRRWRVVRPDSRFVQLAGSTSPYTWTEARRTTGGGSEVVDGGQTGIAYEANGLAGLGGDFLTIDWTAAGDWRCQAIGVRGGGPYTITPFAACHGGPGVGTHCTIAAVADGSTVFDGTTDSHGRISGLTLTPGAYYDLTIDGYGAPRWADSARFITPIGTPSELVVLPPAPGYVCYGPCGYPMSNRMELTGGRQSPVLLSFEGIPELFGAAGYRGTAPSDGTYSLPGGEDIYYAAYAGSGRYWEVGGQYAPGSGDPYGNPFSCSSFTEDLGNWSCDPFIVHFPDCGDPDFGDAGTWTMIEAPPVP